MLAAEDTFFSLPSVTYLHNSGYLTDQGLCDIKVTKHKGAYLSCQGEMKVF